MMARLGYTEEWRDIGIVTDDELRVQNAELTAGADPNPEHYRHRAFERFLSTKRTLSNAEAEAILALRDAGPDRVDLSSNRAIGLISSGLLMDAQLDAIASHALIARAPVGRIHARESVLRRLRREGLTADVMSAVMGSNDQVLQKAALPLASRDQLELLRAQGRTRAIRNQAGERRRRRTP